MPRLLLANQATAAKRRCYFHLVDASDGLTAETGEASGQPQISTNGGAWTNTGIGTLTHIGNGRYYADLTQAAVANAGDIIETRFKSANTAECPGDTFQIVAFDPDDAVRMGLSALPNAAAAANGGLPTVDASNAVKVQSGTGSNQIDLSSGAVKLQGVTHTGATIPTVSTVSGSVGSVAGNVDGNVTGSVGSLATQAKADVNAEVDTALADIHLDHLIASADPGSAVANNSFLAKLTSKSVTAAFSSFDNTTDSLEAIRDKETDIETDTQDIQSRLPAALVSGRIDASIGAYQSGQAPLQPTVAGRTLDVSAGGEAGVDWANVGSTTTTVNLSGTTVKTATDVETDTQDIQSRLPAALVSGRIDASVGAVAADAITAAAIADNAIDAAALAADAVAEIADGVWDEAMSGHTTAGSFGQRLQALRTGTAQAGAAGTITLDASASASDDFYNDALIVLTSGTGSGQARLISDYVGATKVASIAPNWTTAPDNTSVFLVVPDGRKDLALWLGTAPNALISGRVDSNTQAMANDVITAAAIATDAIGAAELATGAVDEIAAAILVTPANKLATDASGNVTLKSGTHTGATVSTVTSVTNTVNADVVAISGDSTAADNAESFFDGTGYAGTNNTIPTVTSVTNQVTANVTAISGDTTAADNLEAALDGTGGVTVTANLTGNVTGNLSGSVGSVSGAVGSVTGSVGGNVTGTIGGFTPSAKAEIQTEAEDALIAHNLDHLVKSAVDTSFANTVHLDSVLGQMSDNGTSATFDRTTDSLEAIRDRGDAAWGAGTVPSAAQIADAVWDEARADHTTAGTFGQGAASVQGNVTGSVGSIASGGITAASIADNAIDAASLAADAGTEIATAVWASSTRTLTQAAASVTSAVSGSTITIYRGTTVSISLTGLGSLTGRTKLWFGVKHSTDDADADSVLQIEETAGLQVLEGSSTVTAGHGTITVTDAATGALTITLNAASAASLAVRSGLTYGIKAIISGTVTQTSSGTCNVSGDLPKAVS